MEGEIGDRGIGYYAINDGAVAIGIGVKSASPFVRDLMSHKATLPSVGILSKAHSQDSL